MRRRQKQGHLDDDDWVDEIVGRHLLFLEISAPAMGVVGTWQHYGMSSSKSKADGRSSGLAWGSRYLC